MAAMFGKDRAARRLEKTTQEIKRLRAEAAELAEQVSFLQGVADDADMRALVSETPHADREQYRAKQDVTTHERLLAEIRAKIIEQEHVRDALLDDFAP